MHAKHQRNIKYWIFTLELWRTFEFSFWKIVVCKFLKTLHELYSSTWFLSWLHVSSNLTWCYGPIYSFKSYILFQTSLHFLTLKQKMYFQLKKPVLLLYMFLQTFCYNCWTLLQYKKMKREIIKCSIRFLFEA